jgi:hypothetical protein
VIAEACRSCAGRVGTPIENLIDEATYQQVIVALPATLKIPEDIFRLGDGNDMSGY